MKDLKYIFIFLSVVVVAILIMCCISECKRRESPPQPEIYTDTIFIEKPRIVEKTQTRYITKIDTFYITGDTTRDTVWIKEIPIEHKQYLDTITTDSTRSVIDVRYSGFHANIDSLYLANSFRYQAPQELSRRKFGFSVIVGPYVGYGFGTNGLSPSVGLGISIGYGYIFK